MPHRRTDLDRDRFGMHREQCSRAFDECHPVTAYKLSVPSRIGLPVVAFVLGMFTSAVVCWTRSGSKNK